MATSGTHNFQLDLAEIIEEAYEQAGSELRSGYDYTTARRSLDLLMLEWQNQGLNLWTVKQATQALTAGQSAYALTPEKLDVIEAVVRKDGTDLHMSRISLSNWARITDKDQTGRPTQFYISHDPANITINVWQVPENDTYSLVYWYMERVEDTGKPGSNNIDVPSRYLPALTSGLAYFLTRKIPELRGNGPDCYAEYERQMTLANDAAREKASFFAKPGGYA